MKIFLKVCFQLAWDIGYFPIWWYSAGSKNFLGACLRMIGEANTNFAPGLWLKNIFVPMFGQTDWQGRIMSFFMRLANVIGRGIAVGIWSSIVLIVFLLYLVIPVVFVLKWVTAIFS